MPGTPDGPPVLGADLMPDADGRYGTAAAELAAMAAAGLGVVRLFASWPALENQVGRYDEPALDELARSVADAGDAGLGVVMCLFCDMGTGDLTDVGWAGRRDLRSDPYMIDRAAALADAVAARLASEPALLAWQLADEAFLAGFDEHRSLPAWCGRITEALVERDPDRPICLGSDPEVLRLVSGVEAGGVADGMSLAMTGPSPRTAALLAPGPGLAGPATDLAGFLARLTGRRLPFAALGIAPAGADLSVADEAGLVRIGLYGALADGADFAFAGPWRAGVQGSRRVPFARASGESLSSLLDGPGGPTPALAEAGSFSAVVAALGEGLGPAPERVAVIVPSAGSGSASVEGLIALRTSLVAFSMAREAHLPVDVIGEGDPLDDVSVLIVPSSGPLGPAAWADVAVFVHEGGTLVVSHGGEEPPEQLRALMGVEYQGETGLLRRLGCRVAQPVALGGLSAFEVALGIRSGAVLSPGRATVLAADASGRPLVTVHRAGRGKTYLLSAPVERALADLPHDEAPTAARTLVSALYRSAAEQAGAAGPVSCDRSYVRTAVLEGPSGRAVVVANHAPVSTIATVAWERPLAAVRAPGSDEASPVGGREFRLPLARHAATVLLVEEA